MQPGAVEAPKRGRVVSAIRTARGSNIPILSILASAAYFISTLTAAAARPYDTDEVFVLWLVRDFPIGRLYELLQKGTDSLPPGFYWLLKSSTACFGSQALALRLPSILGFYIFLGSVYWLARRFAPRPIAVFAACAVYFTQAGDWATVARSYAIMAGCFGMASVLWLRFESEVDSSAQQLLIAIPLAAGVFVHFYSVLFAVVVGLMEFVWTVSHRRIRLYVWIGIVLGAAFVLIWWPLIGPIYRFTHASIAAPGFYARPTVTALISDSIGLLSKPRLMFLMILFGVAIPVSFAYRRPEQPGNGPTRGTLIVIAVTLLLPVITFCFSWSVTGSLNTRYFMAATLAFGLVLSLVMIRLPNGAVVSGYLVIVSILLCLRVTTSYSDPRLAVLAHAAEPLPILLPEASDMFTLSESAPPEIRRRLVYCGMPAGLQSPDPEPQMMAEKWARHRPGLRVVDAGEFFERTPRFYVLSTESAREGLTGWLVAHGGLSVVSWRPHLWLLRADAEGYSRRN